MPIEGTVSKEGDLYKDFTAGILEPGKDKHFLSPFELKMKKLLAKLKKEKMTPKGGKKSKRNIKMARKFRRTRRKRGGQKKGLKMPCKKSMVGSECMKGLACRGISSSSGEGTCAPPPTKIGDPCYKTVVGKVTDCNWGTGTDMGTIVENWKKQKGITGNYYMGCGTSNRYLGHTCGPIPTVYTDLKQSIGGQVKKRRTKSRRRRRRRRTKKRKSRRRRKKRTRRRRRKKR